MKKLASLKTFENVKKMSLNDFNRWCITIYNSGYENGQDDLSEEVIAEIPEDILYDRILSVDGITAAQADRIMKLITGE